MLDTILYYFFASVSLGAAIGFPIHGLVGSIKARRAGRA
jgi:hypothetical protein